MRPNVLLRFSDLIIFLGFANLSLFAQGNAAPPPPQVKVTFYASGNFLKSAVPGYKYGKFSGRIMDEYDQLAMLTFDHFVTFNLDPGPHTFSANSWMIPSPQLGGHLTIDLVAGKHYYIGAYLESLVLASKFHLEQRTCEEAQPENKNTRPFEQKHLKDYGRARFVVETSFPTCP